MSTNNETDVFAALKGLRADYVAHTREQIKEIERYAALCREGRLGGGERQEVKALAHRFVGSGATYGFPILSETARKIEELLDKDINAQAAEIESRLQEMKAACGKIKPEDAELSVSASGASGELERAKKLPKIIAIDDDESVLAILGKTLEKDAVVITGKTADEARRLMLEHKPELVILDDMMKDSISGLKFMEEIRGDAALSSIPVVMLTASNKTEEVLRGLMAGAVDYVIKPFNPADLVEKIRARLSKQRTCVLIAEDDKNVRLLLDFKFRGVGCRVVMCESGPQALEAVKEETPDVIILDRMMPGMDGLAVMKILRDNPKFANTPIIFLTAKKQENEVIEGLRVGAADYIVKPFNPDEVVMRASKALLRQKKK